MTTMIFPIVGSFYRPPAKAILSVIPAGTPLELRAEPTNRVDPNAIAVWISTDAIPKAAHRRLTLAGADCGFRIGDNRAENDSAFLESILAVPEWHLGYIPATDAKTPPAKALVANGPQAGRFIIAHGLITARGINAIQIGANESPHNDMLAKTLGESAAQ